MSRTDKDRPYVLRAADPSEKAPRYFNHVCFAARECTIDVSVIDLYKDQPRRFRYHCGWHLLYSCTVNPPAFFRRHVWYGPERNRENRNLRNLAKEYNANGELEGDFVNNQHRHGAKWLWW